MNRISVAAYNTIVLIFVFSVLPLLAQAHKLNPELIEKITGEHIEEHSEATTTDPRGVERTYASFPEWYIVYSAQEYANFVSSGKRPSQFPYFKETQQYWNSVKYIEQTLGDRKIDPNTKTVLNFIGASFTFESMVIGVYEKTIGRLTEASNFFRKSEADNYTNEISKEYADFLLHTPWYDFPYFSKLPGLWSGLARDISLRGIERRIIFTLGYTLKGVYGKVIATASHSSLGVAELETTFTTDNISEETLKKVENIKILEVYEDGHIRASAPRYRAFRKVVEGIVFAGGIFLDIEGNQEIMLTMITSTDNECLHDLEDVAFSMPILTQPSISRFALKSSVQELHLVVQDLASCKLTIEHIYDY